MVMKNKKILGLILLACSAPIFADNFQDRESWRKKPEVMMVDDIDLKTDELIEQGYVPVMSETFKSVSTNRGYSDSMWDLKNKGNQLGAQIVIFSNAPVENGYYYRYRNSKPDSYPFLIGDNQKSDLNSYPVGTIEAVPHRLANRTEYSSRYFYKYNSVTGIYPSILSSKDKINNGLQGGVIVKKVQADSPAKGVIFPQDIIIKVNDDNINDVSAFVESSNYLRGNTVKFEILRKGQKMPIEVSMKQ
ncbi:PDZ domain-containing protein [Acinetobacter tianfuensis]|uniref:PDZ domain-containing protein n=2 Tax=Acinetobacter tianfuensis TaxID=2419603 RepID=A0A3A8EBP1_9GAMM|nr:PDZ domain-containing protein [Acinetobacter tianfuensis]